MTTNINHGFAQHRKQNENHQSTSTQIQNYLWTFLVWLSQ